MVNHHSRTAAAATGEDGAGGPGQGSTAVAANGGAVLTGNGAVMSATANGGEQLPALPHQHVKLQQQQLHQQQFQWQQQQLLQQQQQHHVQEVLSEDPLQQSQAALFVQATSSRFPPSSAISAATTIVQVCYQPFNAQIVVKNSFYVFQETLEEDQTIVIDLTEERFNMTRGPTAVAGKGGAAAASAASSSSANFKPSVTQWGGVTGGGPIPAPRQFAPSAHHHHHYQGNDLVEPLVGGHMSSNNDGDPSSLEVHLEGAAALDSSSGSHFLISRMLNGAEEAAAAAERGEEGEDGAVVAEYIGPDRYAEILEITATVGEGKQELQQQQQHHQRVPPPHPVQQQQHQQQQTSTSFLPPLNQATWPQQQQQEHHQHLLVDQQQQFTGESEDDDDDRNLSSSIPTERYVEPADKNLVSDQEEGWPNSLSSPSREPVNGTAASILPLPATTTSKMGTSLPKAVPPPPSMPPVPAERRSRSLKRGTETPFSLFGSTSQSLSEVTPMPPTRYDAASSTLHRLRSSDGYRSLDRRMMRAGPEGAQAMAMMTSSSLAMDGARSRSVKTRKSKSNDFLDRMDVSVSSSAGTDQNAAAAHGGNASASERRGRMRRRQSAAKMNKIEKGLYLGNMEAATDVILLESRSISHIVTLDTVPLPRKIASFLPRISQMHLLVTDLPDEDILSHVSKAVEFIRSGMDGGGCVLVHCFRGKSRSAAVILAFIMQKYRYGN